mgnify:CR=1 FL=1
MQSFRIKNIKSFKDSGEITIKPITVLVGQNSCGKSSLLRFPAVLAQTANYVGSNPPISFWGENVDYGNFEDVVFGKENDIISFSLCYKVDVTGNTRISTDMSGNRVWISSRKNTNKTIKESSIDVIIRRVRKSLTIQQIDISIEGTPISSLKRDNESKGYILSLLSMYKNDEFLEVQETIKFSRDDVTFEKFFPIYENDIISAIVKTNNFNLSPERRNAVLKYLFFVSELNENSINIELTEEEMKIVEIHRIFDFSAKIMKGIYTSFNIECKKMISYIGPFRQKPDRVYRNSETAKTHVGAKGENIGNILARAYQSDDKILYDKISKIIVDYFGYELNIRDLGNNYFQLMLKDKNGIESNLIDVGFGISQVLPIISEVCMSSLKSGITDLSIDNLILVEQPELHLHPAAQARLADLFSMCTSTNESTKFIIETHSEHLISKLQVLIADKDYPLTSDMVQILYVDKNEDGQAFIEEMKLKENGKFEKEWPSGFFDQGYTLARQLSKASIR